MCLDFVDCFTDVRALCSPPFFHDIDLSHLNNGGLMTPDEEMEIAQAIQRRKTLRRNSTTISTKQQGLAVENS
jgi:hypothetical protein